jgi:hypothetical protein
MQAGHGANHRGVKGASGKPKSNQSDFDHRNFSLRSNGTVQSIEDSNSAWKDFFEE